MSQPTYLTKHAYHTMNDAKLVELLPKMLDLVEDLGEEKVQKIELTKTVCDCGGPHEFEDHFWTIEVETWEELPHGG